MNDTEIIEHLAKYMDGQSYRVPVDGGPWVTQFPHEVVRIDTDDFTSDHLRLFIEGLRS